MTQGARKGARQGVRQGARQGVRQGARWATWWNFHYLIFLIDIWISLWSIIPLWFFKLPWCRSVSLTPPHASYATHDMIYLRKVSCCQHYAQSTAIVQGGKRAVRLCMSGGSNNYQLWFLYWCTGPISSEVYPEHWDVKGKWQAVTIGVCQCIWNAYTG